MGLLGLTDGLFWVETGILAIACAWVIGCTEGLTVRIASLCTTIMTSGTYRPCRICLGPLNSHLVEPMRGPHRMLGCNVLEHKGLWNSAQSQGSVRSVCCRFNPLFRRNAV